jgi:hypothetical protein
MVAQIAALGVVMALLPGLAPAPASAAACRGPNAVLVLRDLWVEATPSAAVVRPGQSFTALIEVSRPAHEDPADQGIQFEPPASVPAEGISVGISIWSGKRTYFWNIGTSDANGEIKLKLKVPKNAEPGAARSTLFAQHWINQSCPDVLENGFNNYEKFLTIKG